MVEKPPRVQDNETGALDGGTTRRSWGARRRSAPLLSTNAWMRARASGFVLIEASEVAGSAPPPSRRISGTMAFAALSPPRDVRCPGRCGPSVRDAPEGVAVRRGVFRHNEDIADLQGPHGRHACGARDRDGSDARHLLQR